MGFLTPLKEQHVLQALPVCERRYNAYNALVTTGLFFCRLREAHFGFGRAAAENRCGRPW